MDFSFLLHGRVSARGDRCSSFLLVEARTNWSERFLFLRRPKTISAHKSEITIMKYRPALVHSRITNYTKMCSSAYKAMNIFGRE